MSEKEKKSKKFNWFGMYNLDGKGVDKNEPPVLDNPNIPNFFKLLWRKLNKLISINLLMVFGNFPIFFYFIYKAGYFGIESTAPYYQQFAPLYGANMFAETPVMSALYGYAGTDIGKHRSNSYLPCADSSPSFHFRSRQRRRNVFMPKHDKSGAYIPLERFLVRNKAQSPSGTYYGNYRSCRSFPPRL